MDTETYDTQNILDGPTSHATHDNGATTNSKPYYKHVLFWLFATIVMGGILFIIIFFSIQSANNDGNNGEAQSANKTPSPTAPPTSYIESRLPEIILPNDNYHISIYESLTYSPRALRVYYDAATNITLVYVGTADLYVYVLIDKDSDGINDAKYILFTNEVNSFPIASLDISPHPHYELYMITRTDAWKCNNNIHDIVISYYLNDNNYSDYNVIDTLECNLWHIPLTGSTNYHALHYFRFNPKNNSVCISYGVNCNICEPDYDVENYDYDGTISCLYNATDNKTLNIWAKGVRNSVGMDYHPITENLWFTDNGRDKMPNYNNEPDDKLNKLDINRYPQHFGYPYCHSGGTGPGELRDPGITVPIVDSTYGSTVNYNCNNTNYTYAVQPMGPHVASLGAKFHFKEFMNHVMFQDENNLYDHSIFIAQHGSWNRDTKIGYRVMVVSLNDDDNSGNYENVYNYTVFASGWLNDTSQTLWGRPVDVEFLNDGSLLISDDQANVIYRVYYE